MYSVFQLAKKYFKYYLSASNGKGHGIHSPFVFDFIKFVKNDKRKYHSYDKIEELRRRLLQNNTEIQVRDFGAGSSVIKTNKRKISAIAASSLKPKKFSQLLFRMIGYYKPENIAELGTSFGITTSYLASASKDVDVFTFEGADSIASIAQQNFDDLDLSNVSLLTGDFKHTLPDFLSRNEKIGFVFLDGNHRKEPTLDYFEQFLKVSHENTIMVFDDIHWSSEMEAAWEEIKKNAAVTLTIDLFFVGLVFFRKEFKVKQHFTVRF